MLRELAQVAADRLPGGPRECRGEDEEDAGPTWTAAPSPRRARHLLALTRGESPLQAEARRVRSPQRRHAGTSSTSAAPGWTPGSWRQRPVLQQPDWPDPRALDGVLHRLAAKPPLIVSSEARRLTAALAEVAAGRALLLQAGDCAESFDDFSDGGVRDKLKVMLQMAAVLTFASGVHVVKVGRIAGQFAKPRSAPVERVDGTDIPSFRGDIVNGHAPDAEARSPDPSRMLDAYHQSAATLNLLRALISGGFARLSQVHSWNQDFVATSRARRHYQVIAAETSRALRFMRACGIDPDSEASNRQVDYWTSHEALLLPYEEALTRTDAVTGEWYDCSGHMLWVGDRTRQIDGAHVEFLSGIRNPVGCKLGPTTTVDEVVALCRRLDPGREAGRLTLISRLGAARVAEVLPPLLAAVRDTGHPVVWACDPMHANTTLTSSGRKTRRFDDILREIRSFLAVCEAEDVWPGGIHLELTGDDVTECLGGAEEIGERDLPSRYRTACDPRLNGRQAIDLAFRVAELLQGSCPHLDRTGRASRWR
jgi:3-deoxy-7-phosphoheptulonate synthase